MNYIFTILSILSILFLPILSFKETKPKLCIDCKHFIPDKDSGKYSKCFLCPTSQGKANFLVSGTINIDDYYYCTTARSGNAICGEEGKYYKKKYIKKSVLNKTMYKRCGRNILIYNC